MGGRAEILLSAWFRNIIGCHCSGRMKRPLRNKKGDHKMNSSEYNKYLAAIKAANDTADRDALRQIQKQLIANYGLQDNDVDYLIRQFRYHI